MKKISLSLLIIGLTHSLFSHSTVVKKTTQDGLIELNKYWVGKSVNPEITFPNSEKEQIQLHLKLVRQYLSNKDTKHLSQNQSNNRHHLLQELKAYEQRGVFPMNSYHYGRTPYFIDELGTACAVGQLIIKSGNEKLALSISEKYNYRYIEDMPQEPIENWAKKHGFTVDELKWIQPGYGPSCAVGTYRDACANSICGCLNPNLSLLPGVTSLVSEYNDSSGWVVDSFNLWYTMDCARIGNHRITVIDSLNQIHIFNYTIGQKAPINPVIQTTNPTQNCNGSIIANGTQGFYHYLRLLNNTFSTSNFSGSFSNLCSGDYQMYISDSGYFCTKYYNFTLNVSTGVYENEELLFVQFRNPISEDLHIKTNMKKVKELKIFDMRGIQVISQTFSTESFQQDLMLKDGLYLLSIGNGEQVIQKKLIISN